MVVKTTIVIEALLGIHVAILDCSTSYGVHPYLANATALQATENSKDPCGWIGVHVGPMTAAFADSLGMAEPYGAIFDQPEPGSPAAAAGIEQGDVVTAINGSPLMRSTDFADIISMIAPGTPVYLDTSRNGEAMQVKLIVGSTKCGKSG